MQQVNPPPFGKYDVIVHTASKTVTHAVEDLKVDSGVLILECNGVTFWVPLHLLTGPIEIRKAGMIR